MSKKLTLGVIVVLAITNIATLFLWNNESTGNGDGGGNINTREPVATIDGEEISYTDWVQSLRSTHGESRLKTMIDRSVVKQLAEEKNIEVSEKVINREVALLTSMQGPMSEETFAEKEEGWREDIRYRYQLEQLLTEEESIPEEEVQNYYDEYGNQYNFSSSMQLSHIIVDNMDTAEKVWDELNDGATFELLAQEYSIDEETQQDGGYLGFINRDSQFFPGGYEEIANDMEEHSYSEPFRADSGGAAILYVHRKLPEIEFTYDEIKPYVQSELALNEMDQSLTASPLWEELDIEWIFEE
ncbi:peptidylprolyl isomerase [Virgibacillus ainsalahensis]